MKKITSLILLLFLSWGATAAATDARISIQAEVEGWTPANPNTHFGGITLTSKGMSQNITLTTRHLSDAETGIPLQGEVSLSYTREYRGFDFIGFSIGDKDLERLPPLRPGR